MQSLAVSALAAKYGGRPLPVHLLHVNGQILHSVGESVDATHESALEAAGIARVFVPDHPDEAAALEGRFRKLAVAPAEGVGRVLAETLYDGTAVLAKKDTVLSDRVAQLLASRNIAVVQTARSPGEMKRELDRVIEYHRGIRNLEGIDKRLEILAAGAIEEREGPVDAGALDALVEKGIADAPDAGPPIKAALVQHNPRDLRGERHKLGYQDVHDEVLAETEILYETVRARERIESKSTRELVHKIVALLIEDREYLLNLTHIKHRRGYLVNHAVNTAILGVNIATEMGMSSSGILEVGFAAILSDLGMLFVNPKVLDKRQTLGPEDRPEVTKHVGWTLDCLDKVGGLPPAVPLIIYQAHERLNGSGYPKRRTKHLIHRGAQILGVADTYDALTSIRPWREARLPYQAMVEILHMVNQGFLCRDGVVGLLNSVSLFPLGSWLLLDDGRACKAVSTNSRDYCRPRLRAFFQGPLRIDPPELVELAKESGPTIEKALDGSDFEVALSLGF